MEKYRIPVSLANDLHTLLIAERDAPERGVVKRLRAVLSDNERVIGFTVFVTADDAYWYFEEYELAQAFYAEP